MFIAATVIFTSQSAMDTALAPFKQEDFKDFIFKIQEQVEDVAPLQRGLPETTVLKDEVYRTNKLVVYLPEKQRVPYHLVVKVHTPEDKTPLMRLLKRVDAVYHQVGIEGYMLFQNAPDLVHIMPHAPGLGQVKHLPDKLDTYVSAFFPEKRLSRPIWSGERPTGEEVAALFAASGEEYIPEQISYPCTALSSNGKELKQILKRQVCEMLEDRGATVINPPDKIVEMPREVCDLEKKECTACPFCNERVLERQAIFKQDGVVLLNNHRQGDQPGASFLIFPERHFPRAADLTDAEITAMNRMHLALISVLRQRDPQRRDVWYVQETPATGQTVFHHHMQVITVDSDVAPWYWTVRALYPQGTISDKEMADVIRELRPQVEAMYAFPALVPPNLASSEALQSCQSD